MTEPKKPGSHWTTGASKKYSTLSKTEEQPPTRLREKPEPSVLVESVAHTSAEPDHNPSLEDPSTTSHTTPLVEKKIAIIAVHGMGQQIPFQTLDQVGEGLRREEAIVWNSEPGTPRARVIQAGSSLMHRLEMEIRSDQQTNREVHIYETYWAPMTQGVVRIKDVIWFLMSAGWNNIAGVFVYLLTWVTSPRGEKPAFYRFNRWMFGEFQPQQIKFGTAFGLLITLFVLLSLMILNFLVTTFYGLSLLGLTFGINHSDELTNGLTVALAVWELIGLLFGALLVTLIVVKSRRKRKLAAPRVPGEWSLSRGMTFPVYGAFFFLLFATILAGGYCLYLSIHYLPTPGSVGDDPLLKWALAQELERFLICPWFRTGVWVGMLIISLIARKFLLQYIGDVAVYIFSFQLDQFQEVREKIKQRVTNIGHAVYGLSSDETTWEYDHVIIVGHSLGSVIAYDLLNRLIVEDEAEPETQFDVLKRTPLLLTFGSPLDKTAFLFRLQQRKTNEAREALAATSQPLISDSQYRPDTFRWVNVHAPYNFDIVGSALNYYDKPGSDRAVENIADPDATIPLLAHSELWDNRMLWQQLHETIRNC